MWQKSSEGSGRGCKERQECKKKRSGIYGLKWKTMNEGTQSVGEYGRVDEDEGDGSAG